MIIDAYVKRLIEQALREDVGVRDVTTNSILHKAKKGRFVMTAKKPLVVCGLSICEEVFESVDGTVRFKPQVNEGMRVSKGKAIAYVEGKCWSVLAAERTALNFLCWLSGISTLTYNFIEQVKGTKAQILDTRKTIPTLRRLQKYAVKIGGGSNHRMGLYDQVLIKDNHLAAISFEPTVAKKRKDAVRLALDHAKRYGPKGKKVEIEVDSLDILRTALEGNPDIIMLDNMNIDQIREAVQIRDTHRIRMRDVGFKTLLEVSGNVSIENVGEIAKTGIDRISIGALTHSAPSVDISLDVQ